MSGREINTDSMTVVQRADDDDSDLVRISLSRSSPSSFLPIPHSSFSFSIPPSFSEAHAFCTRLHRNRMPIRAMPKRSRWMCIVKSSRKLGRGWRHDSILEHTACRTANHQCCIGEGGRWRRGWESRVGGGWVGEMGWPMVG